MTKATIMRADICDPNDNAAVERFKATLIQLGAEGIDKSWAIGVDLFTLKIGDDVLKVFSDAWSIDVEGPDSLVQKVLAIFRRQG